MIRACFGATLVAASTAVAAAQQTNLIGREVAYAMYVGSIEVALANCSDLPPVDQKKLVMIREDLKKITGDSGDLYELSRSLQRLVETVWKDDPASFCSSIASKITDNPAGFAHPFLLLVN